MRKKALVTGGSRGIGAATVVRLAQMGCDVAFTYLREEAKAQEVASRARDLGAQAFPIQADLSNLERVQAVIEEAVSLLGGLHILVNNAGYVQRLSWDSLTLADWDRMIKVSLTAPFLLIQQAVPFMQAAGFGRIVNVSSLRALTGSAHGVHYSAAKAGLLGLTKSFALALAPHGITVNAVCPGFVDTDINREQLRLHGQDILGQIPLGRVASAAEVAALIAFLSSEEAGYITGATVSVNGGLRMD